MEKKVGTEKLENGIVENDYIEIIFQLSPEGNAISFDFIKNEESNILDFKDINFQQRKHILEELWSGLDHLTTIHKALLTSKELKS